MESIRSVLTINYMHASRDYIRLRRLHINPSDRINKSPFLRTRIFFAGGGRNRLSHCGVRSSAALNIPRMLIHSRIASISYTKKTERTPFGIRSVLSMGYKKDIFCVLNKVSNSNAKSRHSRGYHQFRRNCISSMRSIVYHQAADRCTLKRDEIQPQRG